MSRRGRAIAFVLMALVAAVGAAAIADGYGARALRGYGPLEPVVVLDAGVAAGERIGSKQLGALAVRRVPGRFAPAGALASPAEALGLVARVALPAGSYLLASQLGPPERGERPASGLGGDRRPVEIAVSGADALLSAGYDPSGATVDVVVTSEPSGAGPGRTYVAAPGVPLLALRPGPEGEGAGLPMAATLGLTKQQALKLIAAESFARKVTLLPGG
jgi:Flp pilus assembly protein CpaB